MNSPIWLAPWEAASRIVKTPEQGPSKVFAADILDRFRARAYMPGHDDVYCINRPPPPYCHGTGALWRVTPSRAAGFWPRHRQFPRCLDPSAI